MVLCFCHRIAEFSEIMEIPEYHLLDSDDEEHHDKENFKRKSMLNKLKQIWIINKWEILVAILYLLICLLHVTYVQEIIIKTQDIVCILYFQYTISAILGFLSNSFLQAKMCRNRINDNERNDSSTTAGFFLYMICIGSLRLISNWIVLRCSIERLETTQYLYKGLKPIITSFLIGLSGQYPSNLGHCSYLVIAVGHLVTYFNNNYYKNVNPFDYLMGTVYVLTESVLPIVLRKMSTYFNNKNNIIYYSSLWVTIMLLVIIQVQKYFNIFGTKIINIEEIIYIIIHSILMHLLSLICIHLTFKLNENSCGIVQVIFNFALSIYYSLFLGSTEYNQTNYGKFIVFFGLGLYFFDKHINSIFWEKIKSVVQK